MKFTFISICNVYPIISVCTIPIIHFYFISELCIIKLNGQEFWTELIMMWSLDFKS